MKKQTFDLNKIIAQYLEDEKEGLKQLITNFLNSIMDKQANAQIGALPYERTDERIAHRNGYRKRTLKTSNGELVLNKPQIREFPFETTVFDRYSRVSKTLKNVVSQSYIQGVSTRKVREIVKKLGIKELSPTMVSNIAKELDKDIQAFLNRPIGNNNNKDKDKSIPYVFVDATYAKVRQDHRYVSKAVYIAIGIDNEGYRQFLGLKVCDNETEGLWLEFFENLKDRGLKGVRLIVSDGHKGIKNAVQKTFIGSSWQMCQVHYIRTILSKVPKNRQKLISFKIKEALKANDERRLQELIQYLEDIGLNRAARSAENYIYDVFNYKAFPYSHWRRLKTTNVLERVNKEIKRRIRVVGAFPNTPSLIRLTGAILMDIDEDWQTGIRYLDMQDEVYQEDKDHQIKSYKLNHSNNKNTNSEAKETNKTNKTNKNERITI